MKSKKIIAKISNIYKKQRRGSAPLLYYFIGKYVL